MDTRTFGTNLAAYSELKNRPRLSGQAAEDAYYAEHTPTDGRFSRIAAVIATAACGLVSIGLWLN